MTTISCRVRTYEYSRPSCSLTDNLCNVGFFFKFTIARGDLFLSPKHAPDKNSSLNFFFFFFFLSLSAAQNQTTFNVKVFAWNKNGTVSSSALITLSFSSASCQIWLKVISSRKKKEESSVFSSREQHHLFKVILFQRKRD